MRSFSFLALFGGFFLALPLSTFAAENFSCPEGQIKTPLKSEASGFVCLEEYEVDNLKYDFRDVKNKILKDGEDIKKIPTIIVDHYGDPAALLFARARVFLEKTNEYAQKLCDADKRKPEVHIPEAGVYDDFKLTPTCTVSGGAKKNAFTDISVSFLGAEGENRQYTGHDSSFSGVEISTTGTGEHIVTCSYRPNYCLNPRTVSKMVVVSAPAKSAPQTHSIARQWNDVVLDAIRTDLVRPPVQARNLFHFSAMLYDIWAFYHPGNKTYLLNTSDQGKYCMLKKGQFSGLTSENSEAESMSYAAYRLIKERYTQAPGYGDTMKEADALMNKFAHDPSVISKKDSPKIRAAAFGNFVADCYIRYGLADGSNEAGSHANTAYTPVNTPIDPKSFGNPTLKDWNHWQPIALEVFTDQGGNQIVGGAADFMGAEWGSVKPFSLKNDQKKIFSRDGHEYPVYFDPGNPPLAQGETADEWKWNFSLVGAWSSHLDPRDGVMMDISPANLGNTPTLPTTLAGMHDFYDFTKGGTKALGRPVNPATGKPYEPQIVPRGDYTRTIAEFWADGPNSETPPGHWFLIFNTISDNPLLKKQLYGKGPVVDPLEWDIKSYFTLGGAMHDAAISAWGAKGWYDGIRPVSAIRAMAEKGQSSDKNLPSYDPLGIPLVKGYFELVQKGDPLAGKKGENIGKIKMKAWKGPQFVPNPETDFAGVDWILAGNWWPYQRPSFVTPPFGGYLSGHSTYSRAAAEVLTALTGDSYFPGGIYEVPVAAPKYLVFEQGPSKDFTLQWATYQDAADACSLSRIWGGIHPPADDIPGRVMGEKIGKQAVEYAKQFFGAEKTNGR
ncbi:MAG: vanadium-dependent haloperoxidase [Candidatus Peregrinibacteria bacterium]